MRLKDQEITVLGAGIGGLAVAYALARAGARVWVLEQAKTLRSSGAGLQLSPNGMAVLRALGLGDALRPITVAAQAVQLRIRHYNRQPVDAKELAEANRIVQGMRQRALPPKESYKC